MVGTVAPRRSMVATTRCSRRGGASAHVLVRVARGGGVVVRGGGRSVHGAVMRVVVELQVRRNGRVELGGAPAQRRDAVPPPQLLLGLAAVTWTTRQDQERLRPDPGLAYDLDLTLLRFQFRSPTKAHSMKSTHYNVQITNSTIILYVYMSAGYAPLWGTVQCVQGDAFGYTASTQALDNTALLANDFLDKL
ncbi:hypothetical protein EVAR_28479_1 [Eumeta japonica]|uniref:Uncharacterized protein n=1 Tax=Eumeta variegata TaxID=151549 RepID=A0A4C1WSP3_EUMVA|nr:hypothetical protein EVAR_28479_1 [Eumeta japonica]